MDKIKVDKSELIKVLEQNKSEHRDLFERAIEGYRKEVIRQLDQAVQDVKNKKKVNTYFNIPAPEDHTEDYEVEIGMLNMSLDNEVHLDRNEYKKYVLDDWSWSVSNNIICSGYMREVIDE